MCSGFVFPLLPSPVSFGRVCCSSIHCLFFFFFFCLSMYVCASRRLGLCLRTWACEHKRVCACARARRMTGVTTPLSVPLLSDEGKARSLTHIHWRITSAAKPPLASEVAAAVGRGEAGRGKTRVDMNSAHTYTHQISEAKANHRASTPSQASCRPVWWREIDQLGVFPQNENRLGH